MSEGGTRVPEPVRQEPPDSAQTTNNDDNNNNNNINDMQHENDTYGQENVDDNAPHSERPYMTRGETEQEEIDRLAQEEAAQTPLKRSTKNRKETEKEGPVCPKCRSTTFRTDESGFKVCVLGHNYNEYIQELGDENVDAQRGARMYRVRSKRDQILAEKRRFMEEMRRQTYGMTVPMPAVCTALHFAIARLTREFAVNVLGLPQREIHIGQDGQKDAEDGKKHDTQITSAHFEAVVAQLWATYITLMGYKDIPSLFPGAVNKSVDKDAAFAAELEELRGLAEHELSQEEEQQQQQKDEEENPSGTSNDAMDKGKTNAGVSQLREKIARGLALNRHPLSQSYSAVYDSSEDDSEPMTSEQEEFKKNWGVVVDKDMSSGLSSDDEAESDIQKALNKLNETQSRDASENVSNNSTTASEIDSPMSSDVERINIETTLKALEGRRITRNMSKQLNSQGLGQVVDGLSLKRRPKRKRKGNRRWNHESKPVSGDETERNNAPVSKTIPSDLDTEAKDPSNLAYKPRRSRGKKHHLRMRHESTSDEDNEDDGDVDDDGRVSDVGSIGHGSDSESDMLTRESNRRKNRKRRLNIWRESYPDYVFSKGPVPLHSLIFIYVACLVLNIPILLEDIRYYAISGKISYFATIKAIPNYLRKKFSVYHGGIERKAIPTIPRMTKYSTRLLTLFETCTQIPIAPINHVPIMARMISEVHLENHGVLEVASILHWFLKPFIADGSELIPGKVNTDSRGRIIKDDRAYMTAIKTIDDGVSDISQRLDEMTIGALVCISVKMIFSITTIDLAGVINSSGTPGDDPDGGDGIPLFKIVETLVQYMESISYLKREALKAKNSDNRYAEWTHDTVREVTEKLMVCSDTVTAPEQNRNLNNMDESLKTVNELLSRIQSHLMDFAWVQSHAYGQDELIAYSYGTDGVSLRTDPTLRENTTELELPNRKYYGVTSYTRDATKISNEALGVLDEKSVSKVLTLVKLLKERNALIIGHDQDPESHRIRSAESQSAHDVINSVFDGMKKYASHKMPLTEYYSSFSSREIEEELNSALGRIRSPVESVNTRVQCEKIAGLLVTKLAVRTYSTIIQSVAWNLGVTTDDLEFKINAIQTKLFAEEKVIEGWYTVREQLGFKL